LCTLAVLLPLLPAATRAQQEPLSDRSVVLVEADAAPTQALPSGMPPAPQTFTAPAPAPATAAAVALPVRAIDIGASTEQLLAMQRAARGQRPRPIDGEQASRSYLRYIKSFETVIPEHFSTGVNTGAGGR
jgi:hypothetical protein